MGCEEMNSMKQTLSTICCLVLCSLPALAQKTKAPMTDQQFLDAAAQTDMVEANLGQEAQDTSASPLVKQYAGMLYADHTKDYQALQTLAQQNGMNVPTAIDTDHNKKMIDPMSKLKGAAFDHKYVQDMVAGHTQAIAVYKKEAQDATNPAVKSYAQATLATLEKHLDDAKDLEQGKAPGA
jgi:putative membrane protein